MKQEAAPAHESIIALMQEAHHGETPSDVIRRKAKEVINKHRHLWKGPPFCPFALADLEGVIVEPAPCDIRSDGRIFPKGKDVYIQYNADQSKERINFTICHELAHTLFPDCYKRERRRTPAEKAEWEFENLCNIAASEFLFPEEEFSFEIGSSPLGANQIANIAARFGASIDATARRVVHLSRLPACVIFAVYNEPKGKAVTSLSVQYAVAHPEFAHSIHPNLRINSKSVANRAYAQQLPIGSSLENWYIRGKWARLRVEAIPLPKFESKETAHLAILVY
ncbi:MAG: ImmA/IrrE family metallo-endopeptidase [Luteolibacter sp.]|uniref:ImmA/IrrE family metallo-endopeptidase n=1 Tax=Luteolibacter sp. TaxID=1962973 RepID=UPI0032662C37